MEGPDKQRLRMKDTARITKAVPLAVPLCYSPFEKRERRERGLALPLARRESVCTASGGRTCSPWIDGTKVHLASL